MSSLELVSAVRAFKDYKRIKDEAEAEIKKLQAQITAHMKSQGTDEMTVDVFKVSYKPVTSTRLDTAHLKQLKPDIFAMFSTASTSYRFTVS